MNRPLIAPSILSADFAKLKDDVLAVEKAGADYIHCDVMDGLFVPNISFGPMIVEHVKKFASKPLDVHLMIVEPERYIEQFAKAGSDIITFHADATKNVKAAIDLVKSFGVKVGIAVNPDKPVSLFDDYIEQLDLVLIMSVYAGFGGQKFIPEALEKIAEVKKISRVRGLDSLLIEVDGGINNLTAPDCIEAGANLLVAGSYIFGSDSYSEKISKISNS